MSGVETASAFRAPVVGMVGAGQLARMTHQASVDLGVDLVVLAKSPGDPAVLAGARALYGSPDDPEALARLAGLAEALERTGRAGDAQRIRGVIATAKR